MGQAYALARLSDGRQSPNVVSYGFCELGMPSMLAEFAPTCSLYSSSFGFRHRPSSASYPLCYAKTAQPGSPASQSWDGEESCQKLSPTPRHLVGLGCPRHRFLSPLSYPALRHTPAHLHDIRSTCSGRGRKAKRMGLTNRICGRYANTPTKHRSTAFLVRRPVPKKKKSDQSPSTRVVRD